MAPRMGKQLVDDKPPVGWVKLWVPGDGEYTLIAELGDTVPEITEGYGGWEEVERPNRVGLTYWKGFRPLGARLELWLDNWIEGTTIEPEFRLVEAFAGRGGMKAYGGPRPIKVDTAGILPHDFHVAPDISWVVTDLELDGDSVIVNKYGNWCRAAVAVVLMQHVTDEGLAARVGRVRDAMRKKAPKHRKPHTVKAGETLTGIAHRELGDGGRWREIATLNKIRDPRAPLKVGRSLRLP